MTPTLVGQMVVGAALVLSVAPITAAAQAAMPRDQLRDLTTDRPDTTESLCTAVTNQAIGSSAECR